MVKMAAAVAGVALSALAGPAAAHGDLQSTNPGVDATVRRAPDSVAITFSEAPTAQAVLKVTDGCRRNVTQGIEIVDATATVRVALGQPGRWNVSYRVISALDGHRTQGSYGFSVAGRRDCTPETSAPTKEPPPEEADLRGDVGGEGDVTGSGAPVVPIALGAVAVIVLAFILRRAGSG